MSDEQEKRDGNERGALIAEYVLGLLGPDEHRRVERMIDTDAGLAEEREFWASRFAALDDDFAEASPPTNLFRQIETRLFGQAQAASFWDNLLLWRGIAGGAVAVAIAAIGFNLVQQSPDVTTLTTQLVAALEAEGSDIQFLALYDGTGEVRLTALSGEAVPDHDLELWAIQGGNNPISMGVIPVNARSTVELSDEVRQGWGEGSILAITLEPKGGSPDGNPTGPVVAQGEIHQI